MKRTGLFLAVILLAFALRVVALDAQSLWYDEAVTARVASQGLAELTRWTADDIQPPLYYYVVAGWTALGGRSEWALRFPSVFFSTLTVALLWTVARRLFGKGARGGVAAGAVAVLAAVSPLYVYYAQEARMYALLTFLGLFTGYALLRAVTAQGAQLRWWAALVLASAAMLYTHYFGAFLLLAYALCAAGAWLLAWRAADGEQRGALRRQFGYALGAFIAAGLLFAPWLPAMLTRYRVDASYWQGALKVGEALRHLAVSFAAGAPETMLEPDAVRWLPAVGLAALVAGAGFAWGGRNRRAGPAVILLVVFVLPLAAVLLLASRSPKFNPRYLMLVSPAYLLLLAGGIAGWWAQGRAAGRGVALVLAAVLLAPSLAGVGNWFNNPAFTKAQWREVASYVRANRAADETVVLVSGHAAPAWEYYAPDIAPVRLPPIDILDVTAVLGFDDAPLLAAGLAGRGGAWLVEWQQEVVDPAGFAPFLLDQAGAEQTVPAQFWHVGLRHWRLEPGAAIPLAPQPQYATNANFDHKLLLLGWDDPIAGQLTVYWRALNTVTEDYQASLIVMDAAGNEVGRWDGRPAGYNFPTTRWAVGDVLFGRYPLGLSEGVSAEGYTVAVAVYAPAMPDGLDLRDVADNPAGKRASLGPFRAAK